MTRTAVVLFTRDLRVHRVFSANWRARRERALPAPAQRHSLRYADPIHSKEWVT